MTGVKKHGGSQEHLARCMFARNSSLVTRMHHIGLFFWVVLTASCLLVQPSHRIIFQCSAAAPAYSVSPQEGNTPSGKGDTPSSDERWCEVDSSEEGGEQKEVCWSIHGKDAASPALYFDTSDPYLWIPSRHHCLYPCVVRGPPVILS